MSVLMVGVGGGRGVPGSCVAARRVSTYVDSVATTTLLPGLDVGAASAAMCNNPDAVPHGA